MPVRRRSLNLSWPVRLLSLAAGSTVGVLYAISTWRPSRYCPNGSPGHVMCVVQHGVEPASVKISCGAIAGYLLGLVIADWVPRLARHVGSGERLRRRAARRGVVQGAVHDDPDLIAAAWGQTAPGRTANRVLAEKTWSEAAVRARAMQSAERARDSPSTS
jgi:hypothetical protein